MPTVAKSKGLRSLFQNCACVVVAAMGLCSCAHGQSGVPEAVRARLVTALAPDSGQGVVFFPVRRATELPGATFYRARLDPPIGVGLEDGKIFFASIVSVRDSLVLLASVRDLPVAWALIRPPVPPSPADVVRLVECLGELSGTLSRNDLLSSAAEAQTAFGPDAHFDDSAALDSIAPPVAVPVHGSWQVRFFVMRGSAIQRLHFTVEDNLLTVVITVTARPGLSM